MNLLTKIHRVLRHRWRDQADAERAIPPGMQKRLMHRVSASERRHTGEIRICVEAGLPLSYLWRGATARERAVTLFGKLGVWDTEHNNGVLVYLLLADQAIELVADRGLNQHITPVQWTAMLARMRAPFREGRFEDGLTQALEEVSAVLAAHFPLAPDAQRPNELPDSPVFAVGGDH